MNPTKIPGQAQADHTIMPFGRHRGCPIARLPDHYLRWLSGLELRPWLRAAVDAELRARAGSKRAEIRARRPKSGAHSDAGRPFWPRPGDESRF